MTTTVRYPVRFAGLVSQLNLSDYLAGKLEETARDLESGPVAKFVREARKFGVTDTQIGLIVADVTEAQKNGGLGPTEAA